MWLGLFFSCSYDLPPPPEPVSPAAEADTDTDTTDGADDSTTTEATETDTAPTTLQETGDVTDTDTADTTPQDPGPCPLEMRPITDPHGGAVLYCIDTWEVTVNGELGDKDQFSDGAQPTTAWTQSAEGAIPSIQVSFGQAAAACANTPVLNDRGETVGHKRLATTDEWMDAADGRVGEGGTAYPYGDDFDETLCACQSEDSQDLYHELQSTGSLPGCVSSFGVYDLSGNAWEWVDPQTTIDIDGWWKQAAAMGLSISDSGGYLATEDASEVNINCQGVDNKAAIVVDGLYQIGVDRDAWDYTGGHNPVGLASYLSGDGRLSISVEVEILEPDEPYSYGLIRVMYERDGHPLTNKVGGAYYTEPGTCRTNGDPQLGHTREFDGTIGFRCTADPIQ